MTNPTELVDKIRKDIENGHSSGDYKTEYASVSFNTSELVVLKTTSIEFKLHFHETNIKEEFVFKPVNIRNTAFENQASEPRELGGKAGRLGKELADEFDIKWEFGDLSAASYGGMGELTDYEFKYIGLTNKKNVLGGE